MSKYQFNPITVEILKRFQTVYPDEKLKVGRSSFLYNYHIKTKDSSKEIEDLAIQEWNALITEGYIIPETNLLSGVLEKIPILDKSKKFPYKVQKSNYSDKRWSKVQDLILNWSLTNTIELTFIPKGDTDHYSIEAQLWVIEVLEDIRDICY